MCDLVYNIICALVNLVALDDCLKWPTGEKLDRTFTLEFTLINYRLNCSFSLLTFPKLRFWPPKKKNYKTAP